MTVENISWSISTKECCRSRRGLNPRPPGLLYARSNLRWENVSMGHMRTAKGLGSLRIRAGWPSPSMSASRIIRQYGVNQEPLMSWKECKDAQVGLGVSWSNIPQRPPFRDTVYIVNFVEPSGTGRARYFRVLCISEKQKPKTACPSTQFVQAIPCLFSGFFAGICDGLDGYGVFSCLICRFKRYKTPEVHDGSGECVMYNIVFMDVPGDAVCDQGPIYPFILNPGHIKYELAVLMVWKFSRPEHDSNPWPSTCKTRTLTIRPYSPLGVL